MDALSLTIRPADPREPAAARVVAAHVAYCEATTRAESRHVQTADALAHPQVRFWLAEEGGRAVGCAALRLMGDGAAEIKSMHVIAGRRGGGTGRAILHHLIAAARREGVGRLWLQTGAQPAFAAARRLYSAAGFVPCGPFGAYPDDPNSAFMRLDLGA